MGQMGRQDTTAVGFLKEGVRGDGDAFATMEILNTKFEVVQGISLFFDLQHQNGCRRISIFELPAYDWQDRYVNPRTRNPQGWWGPTPQQWTDAFYRPVTIDSKIYSGFIGNCVFRNSLGQENNYDLLVALELPHLVVVWEDLHPLRYKE